MKPAVAANGPLVSVIWNVRGQPDAARENVLALQAQSYPNFELMLVEDALPSDKTREALRALVANDQRIRFLPRIEVSSGESLISMLRHCRGDYIAICPSEGHFVPDALQFAVEAFEKHANAGIVCGENFLIDAHGKSHPDVDLVTLLFTSFRPFLPAGFFRRRALNDVGLSDENWLFDSVELELCLRLAGDFGVRSFPRKVVECRDPRNQHDGLARTAAGALQDTLQLTSKVFSVAGFWGQNDAAFVDHAHTEALLLESRVNQLGILWERFRALGSPEIEWMACDQLRLISPHFDMLLRRDHRVLRNLHRLFCTRSHNLGIFSTPLQKVLASAFRADDSIFLPYQIWNCTFGIGRWLKRKVVVLTLPRSDHHRAAPSRAVMLADLYSFAAVVHEARGQTDLALDMWKRARLLGSADIDGLACQAMLKLPEATDKAIAAFQTKWVKRHIGEQGPISLATPNVPKVTRKIRIGYHYAFMDSDTIRFMMGNVFRAHDRSRFEIYAYSPTPVASEMASSFDVVRDTGSPHQEYAYPMGGPPAISDDEFVALVRRDEIDVLVEMTGYSMGHRFVAMSRRCAPVQVSFLNHTGSSHVPNLDYIIADEIGVPQSDQPLYSERVQRLPHCFFCFDYRGSETPPIGPPPIQARGYATLGCFGYGGKLNRQLIALWARLLHRVPTAMLHLQNRQLSSANCRQFIASQFRNLGIARDRLVLARGASREALLEMYNNVDISLDTWPYNGGNTIAESLWMGVPVVSLNGDRFSSRYAASLLAAAGCPELVAHTPEEYIEIVARLAADVPRLQSLRRNLRQMSIDHGLADSPRFARDLEDAYVDMLGRAGAGLS